MNPELSKNKKINMYVCTFYKCIPTLLYNVKITLIILGTSFKYYLRKLSDLII